MLPTVLHRFAVYRLAACLLSILTAPPASRAGDWPQILGPQRNGHAAAEGRIPAWQADELRVGWQAQLEQGYAGPAVAGGRVVAFHRSRRDEIVAAWDATSGKQLWSRSFPASYSGGYNEDSGPRCVPLIDGEDVYLFGAAGDLHCVALADGSPRWSRDTYGDFGGREGYFGAGSTPIVTADKLLVNVGGRNAGIVAFDRATGRTLWSKTNEAASYSSPTLTQIGGREAAVFVTRMTALAIDPLDGSVLFQFPFGRSGPTVNAATPLVFDGRLFVTASYGVGAKLARISSSGADIQWGNDDVMSSQYTTSVFFDGHLYGVHGREDGSSELRCLEAASGTLRWRAPEVGVAHVILVNDQLLILDLHGKLILAPAAPDRFRPLASAQLTRAVTRALPAYSNGRLIFRDAERLQCYVLAPPL